MSDTSPSSPSPNPPSALGARRSALERPPSALAVRKWALALSVIALGAIAYSATLATKNLDLIQTSTSVAVTTSGPWASMIFVARTDSGLIAIDLGWTGARQKLTRATARLNATPADIRYVFLTHGHRDHTYGWRFVRQATFALGAGEVAFFTGGARYRGALPRIGDRLVKYPHPRPSELSMKPLGGDTMFVFGRDTLYAFPMPGHTPGSTAYLFRGVLFGGDAINWRPWTGFRGARPEFSDDVEQSRASMRLLWSRLDSSRVRVGCSAHAKCGRVDSAFRAATSR